MRFAIFLAIACVAMSAPLTEENIQAEEVNPLTSEVSPLTSEVSAQELVEAYHPVNKNTKDSNALPTNGRKLLGRSGRRCSRRGNLVKWGGGRKRIGRHLYGQRMLYSWGCNRYIYRRWWWALLRRNHYNHRLHGRRQWRWTNHYRRIGVHRYRLQTMYRNYQGHWRKVRSVWRLNRRNAYSRRNRWFWERRVKRVGKFLYRYRSLKRWTGSHWVKIRGYWKKWKKVRHHRRRMSGHRRCAVIAARRHGYCRRRYRGNRRARVRCHRRMNRYRRKCHGHVRCSRIAARRHGYCRRRYRGNRRARINCHRHMSKLRRRCHVFVNRRYAYRGRRI